jgi:hypothetical protein
MEVRNKESWIALAYRFVFLTVLSSLWKVFVAYSSDLPIDLLQRICTKLSSPGRP